MAYAPNPYFPFYNPAQYTPQAPVQQPDMMNRQFQPAMSTQPMQQPMAQQIPMQMPMQQTNDMLWVLGEVEATSYPVAPNNSVILWDKNAPTIYIKSVDGNGVPSMRTLDFTERTQNAPQNAPAHECKCASKFVPIADFNALREEFAALRGEFHAFAAKAKEGDE